MKTTPNHHSSTVLSWRGWTALAPSTCIWIFLKTFFSLCILASSPHTHTVLWVTENEAFQNLTSRWRIFSILFTVFMWMRKHWPLLFCRCNECAKLFMLFHDATVWSVIFFLIMCLQFNSLSDLLLHPHVEYMMHAVLLLNPPLQTSLWTEISYTTKSVHTHESFCLSLSVLEHLASCDPA